jgi:hypothetical protein
MLTIKDLKKPETLGRIRFSVWKKEIAIKCDEKRQVKEVGYFDLEYEDQIHVFLKRLNHFFYRFHENFPEEPLNPA